MAQMQHTGRRRQLATGAAQATAKAIRYQHAIPDDWDMAVPTVAPRGGVDQGWASAPPPAKSRKPKKRKGKFGKPKRELKKDDYKVLPVLRCPDLGRVDAAYRLIGEQMLARAKALPGRLRPALVDRNGFRYFFLADIKRDFPDLRKLPREIGRYIAQWMQDEYMRLEHDLDRIDLSQRKQRYYFEYITVENPEQVGVHTTDIDLNLPKGLGIVTVRCVDGLYVELAYTGHIRSVTLERSNGELWAGVSFRRGDDDAPEPKKPPPDQRDLLELAVCAFDFMEPCARTTDGVAVMSGKRMRAFMKSRRYKVPNDTMLATYLGVYGVHPKLVRTRHGNRRRYYRADDVYEAEKRFKNYGL